MRPIGRLVLMALVVPLGAGCQRLEVERAVTVDPGTIRSISVDPPRGEQKVAVVVISPGVPVDVSVVTQNEQEAVKKTLEAGKRPDASKLLSGQEKVENAVLEATVPARTGFMIFLSGARKSTDVKVKITGR
jgi:hypothetical protein